MVALLGQARQLQTGRGVNRPACHSFMHQARVCRESEEHTVFCGSLFEVLQDRPSHDAGKVSAHEHHSTHVDAHRPASMDVTCSRLHYGQVGTSRFAALHCMHNQLRLTLQLILLNETCKHDTCSA